MMLVVFWELFISFFFIVILLLSVFSRVLWMIIFCRWLFLLIIVRGIWVEFIILNNLWIRVLGVIVGLFVIRMLFNILFLCIVWDVLFVVMILSNFFEWLMINRLEILCLCINLRVIWGLWLSVIVLGCCIICDVVRILDKFMFLMKWVI